LDVERRGIRSRSAYRRKKGERKKQHCCEMYGRK